MRHLGPPGLLKNVKDIICGFLILKEIERNILPDTPLSPSYTLQHPKTPSDTPRHSDITPDIAICTPRHSQASQRERERFISSHDIGCIFSYKLRYFRQTCGAYMVNTDLLPAAPQIGILSSFFLVELPDSKSQLLEQIVLSIMVFCLGGSHQSLKIFCFNLKKVLKIKKKSSIIIKTRYALRRCLTGTENRGNPARPSRRKLNPVFIIILIIITKIKI